MTFKEVFDRIIKFWWLSLILTILFTLVFFDWAYSESYKASIGIGIGLNSSQLENYLESTQNPLDINYPAALGTFSRYLSSRFNSVEIQEKISQKANIQVNNLVPSKAFYEVVSQDGGYVTLTYESKTEAEANNFINAVINVFVELVKIEQNNSNIPIFQAEVSDQLSDYIWTVKPVRKNLQLQILPSILGLMTGLFLSIIIPEFFARKKIETS